IGAMTNWTDRVLSIDLSFLQPGKKYNAIVLKDGEDADSNAESYKFEEIGVNNKTKLTLRLASGGGAVLRIIPQNNMVYSR
ncbi:MAG TPA: glycoside hydrolase family 97 C-terminal domain-containing protein, partial [Flavitalea sp.]|nr:glycoside hydrolase family 97 C-terminal domain-containing protein [Flavitalea sp.]